MIALEPDKSRTFSISLYSNLVRTGVLGDGSCFFHALFYAISSEYRKLDMGDRVQYVYNMRNKIVSSFSYTKWKNLGDGETFRMLIINELREMFPTEGGVWDDKILPDIANNWKDKSMTSCAEILDKHSISGIQGIIDNASKRAFHKFIQHLRSEWVDDYMLEFLSITFECNFLFIDANTRKPYQIFSRDMYNNYIVFCYIDESHYEIIGELNSKNVAKRIFDRAHPFVQSIINEN